MGIETAIGNRRVDLWTLGILHGQAFPGSEAKPLLRCSDHISSSNDRDIADRADVCLLCCKLASLRHSVVSMGKNWISALVAVSILCSDNSDPVSPPCSFLGAVVALSGIGKSLLEASEPGYGRPWLCDHLIRVGRKNLEFGLPG